MRFAVVLALAALLGAGVGAGLAYLQEQQAAARAAAPARPVGPAAGGPASTGANAVGTAAPSAGTTSGGAGPTGRAVATELQRLTGTVASVGADGLVVETTAGAVTVRTDASTAVRRLASGSRADLAPGVALSVTGETVEPGRVRAAQVQVLPAGLAPTGGGERAAGSAPGGARGPAGGPGRAGPVVAGGPGGRAAGFGTVERLDGDTLYLNGPAGQTRVELTDATQVQVVRPAARSDLKPGDSVSVAYRPDSSGAPIAVVVDIVPAS